MIRIHNTMSGNMEEFKPVEDGKVKMYVCGPTVYNYIHVGNARPVIFFDTVRRYFEYKGYTVDFVQNFTDIDDKIINKANEEGVTIDKITEKYIEAFLEDTRELNIKEAGTIRPKATENIKEMIDFVKRLEDKGYAYEIDGDVYFSIEKFKEYGKLSHQNLEELNVGNRVDVDDRKRSPMDFALWKKAKPNEPSWTSNWGEGRPGWHLECSVMSMKHLGETLDIHGGGEDLIFPHHENEIAQSESLTGKNFSNYWMHNRFLNINGEKMSKSRGNFSLLRDVLNKYEGRIFRFFILSAHYRKPVDFSEDEIIMASSGLERIDTTIRRMKEALNDKGVMDNVEALEVFKGKIEGHKNKFESGMDEDFNTAIAIGAIFEAVKDINLYLDKEVCGELSKKYIEEVTGLITNLMENVLGVKLKTENVLENNLTKELIDFMVDLRWNAKSEKNWALADKIRNKLGELGVKLEDKKDKTLWSL